jgi:hypothetical protein
MELKKAITNSIATAIVLALAIVAVWFIYDSIHTVDKPSKAHLTLAAIAVLCIAFVVLVSVMHSIVKWIEYKIKNEEQ